jgi:tetratricopeptide (TPR) repeat protein
VGKIEEARAAYQKSAELNPAGAANVWMNLGIVLWQNYRYEEAIEPLQKSLELNPRNAQAWYVLGASLVGLIEFKQEGDKSIPILRPGTVEAYQKCIEVDPNGPFAAQARQALAELEAIGVGISTKVNVKKKKG